MQQITKCKDGITMKASDLRPGANVIGTNGQNYTVVKTYDQTISINRTMCIVENESGQTLSVPSSALTPVGKNAAQVALLVGERALTIGTKATFLINTSSSTSSIKGKIVDITKTKITIDADGMTIGIKLDNIIGVSLIA